VLNDARPPAYPHMLTSYAARGESPFFRRKRAQHERARRVERCAHSVGLSNHARREDHAA